MEVTTAASATGSDFESLRTRARNVRRLILQLAGTATGCHLGGCLSVVEILIALFGHVMRTQSPASCYEPSRYDSDHLVFSKGHAAAGLYAALAEFGWVDAQLLIESYNADGSPFTGHANARVPGVEFSTGSLGHGLGLGVGLALGRRLREETNSVFVVCGDGEMGEGSNWEAMQLASQHRLANLTLIVDRNGGQNDGDTESILAQRDLLQRLQTFGFQAFEVDGHDLGALCQALQAPVASRPRAVVANTQKGAGLPMLQGKHAHYATFTATQLRRALRSLEEASS